MEKLTAIEVCEIGQIKVMGVKGKLLPVAIKECIDLSNLLLVSVKLYWNDKTYDIYTDSNVSDIMMKDTVDEIVNKM